MLNKLHGAEEYNLSGFPYADNTISGDEVILGFGLFCAVLLQVTLAVCWPRVSNCFGMQHKILLPSKGNLDQVV